jgi:hypothetical protein
MGLLTWILLIVVVLAIIGLGVGTFFSGVWTGFQKVGSNPVVQNATDQAKEGLSDKAGDAKDNLLN